MRDSPTLKAMKQLSRQRFDHSRIQEFLASINSGNDRAVAIVWGALVEDALHAKLVGQIGHLNSDEKEMLFSPNGLLDTFSAKILVAYVAGFTNKEDNRDLTLIKEIRNVFAHGILDLSFDIKEVNDVCCLFSRALRRGLRGPINGRLMFVNTCAFLWAKLDKNVGSLMISPDRRSVHPIIVSDEETP